jgi:integrase/recombinase XerD
MLQDLFPRDHKRYEESRFGAELEAFANWLAAQGHLRYPLRLHLHRVRAVLEGCDRFQTGGTFKEEDLRQALFPVQVPTNTSALAASSPASWPPRAAWSVFNPVTR